MDVTSSAASGSESTRLMIGTRGLLLWKDVREGVWRADVQDAVAPSMEYRM